MKHLLKLGGLTPEEILHILDVADDYKRLHKDGIDPKDLQGKAVALVFAKNSTRTRTSLEVGIYQMGGLGTYLSANDLQTARGEPVQDTPPMCWRPTPTKSLTRPRTAFTSKKPCWPFCWQGNNCSLWQGTRPAFFVWLDAVWYTGCITALEVHLCKKQPCSKKSAVRCAALR